MMKTLRLALLSFAILAMSPFTANGAESCPQSGFFLVHASPTPGTRPLRYAEGILNVDRTPITTSEDLAEVHLSSGPDDSAVLINYSAGGVDRLGRATTGHAGTRIAFLVGDKVLMAVTWEGD